MTSRLPAVEPLVSPEARPFWEAARDRRLLLQRCASCRVVVWYPRGSCPDCGSIDLEWSEASGRGVIYSYTVNHRGDGAFKAAAPYVLAYVELEEGPRILTNIVDCDPAAVSIGQQVRAVFEKTEHAALVRFVPA